MYCNFSFHILLSLFPSSSVQPAIQEDGFSNGKRAIKSIGVMKKRLINHSSYPLLTAGNLCNFMSFLGPHLCACKMKRNEWHQKLQTDDPRAKCHLQTYLVGSTIWIRFPGLKTQDILCKIPDFWLHLKKKIVKSATSGLAFVHSNTGVLWVTVVSYIDRTRNLLLRSGLNRSKQGYLFYPQMTIVFSEISKTTCSILLSESSLSG